MEEQTKIKIEPVPLLREQDLEQILQEVVHTSDAIYLTGGRLVHTNVALIVSMAAKQKLITITHLESIVQKGALVGVCANPYLEGRMAGKKIARILQGDRPSSIPVGTPDEVDIILNTKTVADGQFVIPDAFMKKVTKTTEQPPKP